MSLHFHGHALNYHTVFSLISLLTCIYYFNQQINKQCCQKTAPLWRLHLGKQIYKKMIYVWVYECVYSNNNLTLIYWVYKIKHWTLLRDLRDYSSFLSLGRKKNTLFSLSFTGVTGGLFTNLQECWWINSSLVKPFTWKNTGCYVMGPLLKKPQLWR